MVVAPETLDEKVNKWTGHLAAAWSKGSFSHTTS